MRIFFTFLLVCIYFLFPFPVFAIGFTDFRYGHDISYPQCGKTNYLHAGSDFGIVGVNGGKAFTKNPCLRSEFSWARNLFSEPSVYINVNGAIGRNASKAFFGPRNCHKDDEACLNYNFGWQTAFFAYSQAFSKHISSEKWWMDVELANSWNDDFFLNRMVLLGVKDFFQSPVNVFMIDHIQLGVYSTGSMRGSITGDWKNMLPVWLATGESFLTAKNFCRHQYAFTGGRVLTVQYYNVRAGLDEDYLCE